MNEQRVQARRLQKRIEVFLLTPVSDGFSGSTVDEVSQGFYWCDINSINTNSRSASNLATLGITDFGNAWKITMRYYDFLETPKDVRLKKGNYYYEIISVNIIDERKTRVEIIAKVYQK